MRMHPGVGATRLPCVHLPACTPLYAECRYFVKVGSGVRCLWPCLVARAKVRGLPIGASGFLVGAGAGGLSLSAEAVGGRGGLTCGRLGAEARQPPFGFDLAS